MIFTQNEYKKINMLYDSFMKDSAASDVMKEIKAAYPQVKIKAFGKSTNGAHMTIFQFSNYPGENTTGFRNDPRTKERDNWERFLLYLVKKYNRYDDGTGRPSAGSMYIYDSCGTKTVSNKVRRDSLKDYEFDEARLGVIIKKNCKDLAACVDRKDYKTMKNYAEYLVFLTNEMIAHA